MHKTLVILALFSVGCAHAAAAEELNVLRLHPLAEPELLEARVGGCSYQLKGTKNPKVRHLVQAGACLPCGTQGRPAKVRNCIPSSVINVNNNQMALPRTADGEFGKPAFYKYGDFAVEINSKPRDCEKVSCDPFSYDAVLVVKKGSLQQTFEMQGDCDVPN